MNRILPVVFAAVLMFTACSPSAPAATSVVTVNVMVHDSFAVSEDVVRAFEESSAIKLVFIPSGDAGAMINRAVLTKDAPQADILYGVDNTLLSRALEADLFEPYASPLLADIDPSFRIDAQNRALPVDYGDVCINYDRAFFTQKNLPLPGTLEDLLKPEYKGLLVVESPATSSPGLAFLMASVAQFGEQGYLAFWKALRENGVLVVNDWETAYYTHFSASSGQGAQPMVVSYATSPAAEVVFASQPLNQSPTASLTGAGMCYRQVEFVGILKGTRQRAAAQKVVDFLLDKAFQEDIPLQMFVYPVNRSAALPDAFLKHAQVPDKPAALDMNLIASRRDEWITAWTETVLR